MLARWRCCNGNDVIASATDIELDDGKGGDYDSPSLHGGWKRESPLACNVVIQLEYFDEGLVLCQTLGRLFSLSFDGDRVEAEDEDNTQRDDQHHQEPRPGGCQ